MAADPWGRRGSERAGGPLAGALAGGLGIGLSLVRSLVELRGGRVMASSEGLGKGSEFAVYLPLANGKAP